MKQLFTLFLYFLLPLPFLYAQSPAAASAKEPLAGERSFWDEPQHKKAYIRQHNIRKIEVQTYDQAEPEEAHLQAISVYEYSDKFNLTQLIETQAEDTSRICKFRYTENGTLTWKYISDKSDQKTYKSGYRFNRNQTVFQVKSYEMLPQDQVMLLDTRQYVYDDEGRLSAIRCLENDRLLRVHRFGYDSQGRVIQERFETREGDLARQVDYVYDDTGRPQRITTLHAATNEQQAYVYAYDEKGLQTRIEWWTNDQIKGSVDYAYDESGKLTHMNRVMQPSSGDEPQASLQVYRYETDDNRGTD
jgi:hypothetical protein